MSNQATGRQQVALSNEVLQLIERLHLSKDEGRLLTNLADEAVSKFESDHDAINWMAGEVRSRRPALWRLIVQQRAQVG